ncbi:MAG: hypothetical protein KatS3mg085_709 [Candidatus Dojkabacteria bacterium]|nr:MAG: hypothetical protein KatS3mg085_709 [Candidatus Dojkabacteria bacterium]GIW58769.1 MAG: hypothetical protein KatS3mg086_054 [Candidatus Dojkabacteria bacterium]
MKGPVVGMIYAFVDLIKEGIDKEIGLMITSDEEQGGFDGVDYLLNEEGFSCDCAFVPDTGKKNWEICTGEKGVWFVEVESKGKSAHSSRPWEGVNAINELWKAYNEIETKFNEVWGEKQKDSVWIPTISLSKIEGGDAFNKVPDKALGRFDIRFPSEIGLENIKKIVMNVFKERNVTITSEPVISYGMNTDEQNYFLKKWIEVLKNKNLKKPEFYKALGGSDSRFFSANGIPVVMCKSKCSDIHIVNEWCDIEDLEIFRKLVVEWVKSV